MTIAFNAPFTLVFTFAAIIASVLNVGSDGMAARHFFSVYGPVSISDPYSIIRVIGHPLGHGSWGHLTSNFSIILLIGPLVEGYYGSWRLSFMAFITAVATGVIHVTFFDSALMGASGIVFMMILLGSFANSRKGSIPLTFVLVGFIYIGNEVVSVFQDDNISQLAHIIGACCGAVFGFLGQNHSSGKRKKNRVFKSKNAET